MRLGREQSFVHTIKLFSLYTDGQRNYWRIVSKEEVWNAPVDIGDIYLFELVFLFPSDKRPEGDLLDHMVVLFLICLLFLEKPVKVQNREQIEEKQPQSGEAEWEDLCRNMAERWWWPDREKTCWGGERGRLGGQSQELTSKEVNHWQLVKPVWNHRGSDF